MFTTTNVAIQIAIIIDFIINNIVISPAKWNENVGRGLDDKYLLSEGKRVCGVLWSESPASL